MKKLFIQSARKVLQNKEELEKKLNVKISVSGTDILINGNKVDEYFAERVLMAIDFPFTIDEVLLLKSEDFMFEVLNVKDYTKRHDLRVIRGRLIGTKGNTLRVIEELSDCIVAVKKNNIAIIGSAGSFETARQAIISLIHGSKQGNVYQYLENARARAKNNF
jgi:KH domain-containing protein